jgi:hypothetical protein
MLAAALLMTATVLGQAYEVKYDKFDDRTDYRVNLMKVEEQDDVHDFSLYHSHKGEGRVPARDSDKVDMLVYRHGRDLRYQKFHGLVIMQGRDRFRILEPLYDNAFDTKLREISELIDVDMTIAEVKKHLKTRTPWEVKIGIEDPFTIDPMALAKVAAFIEAIQKPE